MKKKKEIPLPRIYEIIGEDCMEKCEKKLVKKVPKKMIEEMCDENELTVSFKSLQEESDLFCVFISKSQDLVVCQIIPDEVDGQNKVIRTGKKFTLMTLHGARDIRRLFKHSIWRNSTRITEDHISSTQKTAEMLLSLKVNHEEPKEQGQLFHYKRYQILIPFFYWNSSANYYHYVEFKI